MYCILYDSEHRALGVGLAEDTEHLIPCQDRETAERVCRALNGLRERAERAERQIRLLGQGALAEVAAERRRQVEEEGWTVSHDDDHGEGTLSDAGAAYAVAAYLKHVPSPPLFWPWARGYWKPKTPRENLVRAAALIVAEIERLDRKAELEAELAKARGRST